MAIDAKELRIGNIVESDFGYGWEQMVITQGIDIHHIQYNQDNYQAVPLTVKWLERMGFVIGEGPADGFIVGVNGARLQRNLIMGGYNYFDTGSFLRSIQYVHQLQNLFFMLTGEELTFSEKLLS